MAEEQSAGIGYKPLYMHVRESLVQRLIDGRWQPGEMIPSEIQLAQELNVSQGTVRKALDTMVKEYLLVRRQGRGTFVAQADDAKLVFQFFRLKPDEGGAVYPDSRLRALDRAAATDDEAEMLDLAPGAAVIRMERLRSIGETPVIAETITLSADRFPGFPERDAVPNNLYHLYSTHWGITIAQAEETLKAVAAGADAAALGCSVGAPLLRVHRLARDLSDRPVELRISRCLTDALHYAVKLT